MESSCSSQLSFGRNPSDTILGLSSFFFLAQHLNTNYIPSDAEVPVIKSFLVQPTRTLQQMKDEMLRVQEQLKTLARKHDDLARELDSCRSLLTLARRLPDDILREIFHHSLPEGLNARLTKQYAPLVFTQVCSRWRRLAISTPTLWSKIHIGLVNTEILKEARHEQEASVQESMLRRSRIHKKRATAVMDWLKRSGPLPIYISLFAGQNPISSLSIGLYEKSLLPSSSRWRSLFLQAPGASFQEMATIPARNLNALESLFLHFERQPGVRLRRQLTDSPWIQCGLFMAPSLRKLSIRQDIFDPTAISVNWSTLTHLEIVGAPDRRGMRHSPYLSLPKASSILRLCSRLVYCSIELGPTWFEQESNIPMMHLPLLQRLSIGERIDIQPFVERLNVPLLEELTFRSTNVASREHSNCLAILSKAGETIRKLTITSEFFSNRLFLECLKHCPYLASLTVAQHGWDSRHYDEHDEEELIDPHFKIDDLLLERFTTKGPDSLCPYLEELICGINTQFTLTGFLEFLRRKQTTGDTEGLAKLKSLSIKHLPKRCNTHEISLPEIPELLQPYISGMEFQIKTNGLETSNWEVADYGNSACQYATVWRD